MLTNIAVTIEKCRLNEHFFALIFTPRVSEVTFFLGTPIQRLFEKLFNKFEFKIKYLDKTLTYYHRTDMRIFQEQHSLYYLRYCKISCIFLRFPWYTKVPLEISSFSIELLISFIRTISLSACYSITFMIMLNNTWAVASNLLPEQNKIKFRIV